ncbi:hypothetical protein GOP47_0014076, partial [Adiantum capillus-veneris]
EVFQLDKSSDNWVRVARTPPELWQNPGNSHLYHYWKFPREDCAISDSDIEVTCGCSRSRHYDLQTFTIDELCELSDEDQNLADDKWLSDPDSLYLYLDTDNDDPVTSSMWASSKYHDGEIAGGEFLYGEVTFTNVGSLICMTCMDHVDKSAGDMASIFEGRCPLPLVYDLDKNTWQLLPANHEKVNFMGLFSFKPSVKSQM